MAEVQEVRPDFGIFLKSINQDDYVLTFYKFIKIFLFGDIFALMSTSPFAASNSPTEHLEPEFAFDNMLREDFFGDPVKQAMFVQSLRRWPYMTAIPVIFTFSIFIGSLLKLIIPFIRRFTSLLDSLMVENKLAGAHSTRKKRDIVALERIKLIPSEMTEACTALAAAVEAVEYLALSTAHDEDAFRWNIERHSVLYNNVTKPAATANMHTGVKIGKMAVGWIAQWQKLKSRFHKCLDQIVSCHLRPSRKGVTECQHDSSKSACVTLLGAFLASLTSQKNN